jgi:hypothetical protein
MSADSAYETTVPGVPAGAGRHRGAPADEHGRADGAVPAPRGRHRRPAREAEE